MQRNFPAKRSGRDADGPIIGNGCNAAKKENIVEINNIHENSNNYNKHTKDSSDEAKSAGKAETILRAMTADDLPAVERIEQTCFSDAWSEKLLSDMLESEWDEAWVLADEKNSVIGYANFRFLAGEGELMRIAVLPEYRGHGESKKLMDRLEISSREKEAPDLTLEVRAGNTPAINLYKFYGFQAVSFFYHIIYIFFKMDNLLQSEKQNHG